ncbi:hypothetical protein M3G91_28510 [Micromonospora chalcea]|uniref:hypothetical protein n=1 Tax=Micromonospora chalcea TaxID=1874 RepID=UPI0021A42017|nr:hypothetical protein [Micromonospora chalcea]MCT2281552.1 hypothetical protein [Micromonospora chalcea]
MPTTPLGIEYPSSVAHTRLWEHFQTLAEDVDELLALPADQVAGSGLTTNAVTATAFTALPNNVQAVMSNPSSKYRLLVDVVVQAWVAATTGDVRVSVAGIAGLTFPATPGAGGPVTFGEVIVGGVQMTKQSLEFAVAIPTSGSVTLQVQALRTVASGSQTVNYPTLRVKPRRFVLP